MARRRQIEGHGQGSAKLAKVLGVPEDSRILSLDVEVGEDRVEAKIGVVWSAKVYAPKAALPRHPSVGAEGWRGCVGGAPVADPGVEAYQDIVIADFNYDENMAKELDQKEAPCVLYSVCQRLSVGIVIGRVRVCVISDASLPEPRARRVLSV